MNSNHTTSPASGPIRVRFAPSPTGDLHVGGVRTALFNYLFARHHGGTFLLRIEDTDKERSTPAATQVILDGLAWLGINPDEPIVYQGERIERHKAAALQILESGLGYRCFCNPDELTARREAARAAGKQFKYDRACLKLSKSEIEARMAAGIPWAVRVKVPDEDLTFDDGVHGAVKILGEDLEDFVLLRGDGTPTYMLAVVVDDIDMGVTHIIRGDEHLLNSPKQALIYKALGKPTPKFAHVPLILGTDKKKLSKRHGATSITWYKDQGYLPETMINFLGLLGWSPGDDRNVISLTELIELFGIDGIIPSGAVFDDAKLKWLNGQYLSQKSWEEVRWAVRELEKSLTTKNIKDTKSDDMIDEEYLAKCWGLIKSRIYVLSDLFGSANYLFEDPSVYDEKGAKKHFAAPVTGRLRTLASDFAAAPSFDHPAIEEIVRRRAEEWGVSAGALIHPLRLSVSGTTVGPGLFELLEVLGKEAVVRRIGKAVAWIEGEIV
jgi:glutamyl-tRNA synthetase